MSRLVFGLAVAVVLLGVGGPGNAIPIAPSMTILTIDETGFPPLPNPAFASPGVELFVIAIFNFLGGTVEGGIAVDGTVEITGLSSPDWNLSVTGSGSFDPPSGIFFDQAFTGATNPGGGNVNIIVTALSGSSEDLVLSYTLTTTEVVSGLSASTTGQQTIQVVPEPGTVLLLGTGLLAMARRRSHS